MRLIRIAIDPVLFRPASPALQLRLGGTISEERLKELFPPSTWFHEVSYLMGLAEVTEEDLVQASQRCAEIVRGLEEMGPSL
jgi:hypothetical protein